MEDLKQTLVNSAIAALCVFTPFSVSAQPQAFTGSCHQKISETEGNFTGPLDSGDSFPGIMTSIGDLNGDGVTDVAVCAADDDDGGTNRGAVWILFLNPDHTVKSHQKISDTQGNFTGILNNSDRFGRWITSLGDLDGDGVTDIAVGAIDDDDGGTNRGAVWILFLNTNGTVKSHQKISDTAGNFTGSLADHDWFGFSVTCIGDLDGDGVVDLTVGAGGDDDEVIESGSVWVLFLNTNGTVKSHQKISNTAGNFTGTLDAGDYFGCAATCLDDLDGDGVADVAIGARLDDDGGTNRGAVWILFLNADGTVKNHQKISDTEGNFTGTLFNSYQFGAAMNSVGDLDGDGFTDLAIGGYNDNDGGTGRGAVWILFLYPDGTVKSHQKISDTQGNFSGVLDDGDGFSSPALLEGPDCTGAVTLAVGALGDDDGGANKGAIWILFERVYCVDEDAADDPCHGVPAQVIGDANFSDPNEDGSCEHPFDSIQKAVDYAANYNCDCNCPPVVVVFDGNYTGIGNYDIDTNGLAVRIKSQNGPDQCVIDCNSDGRAFVFNSGEDVNTVIDGFTIVDGNMSKGGIEAIDNCGGAIYCANSSPAIANCTIAFNYAAWSGGAIFCQDSNAQISNCTIIGNSCDASGGGLCCVGGSATIKNSLIAFNDGDFSGGASSIYDSNLSVINCTIADNFAWNPIGAGGIHCGEGDAVITNTILWYNYSYDNNQIELYDGSETVIVTYSDVQMPDINDPCWPGVGNINAEPLFADYYFLDYHLKSAAGRWTPIFSTNGDFNNDGFIDFFDFAIFVLSWQNTGPGQLADLEPDNSIDLWDLRVFVSNWLEPGENILGWILDDVTSPCIDAGDPVSDYSLEPAPNGGIINMGTYGNTQQASKSTN